MNTRGTSRSSPVTSTRSPPRGSVHASWSIVPNEQRYRNVVPGRAIARCSAVEKSSGLSIVSPRGNPRASRTLSNCVRWLARTSLSRCVCSIANSNANTTTKPSMLSLTRQLSRTTTPSLRPAAASDDRRRVQSPHPRRPRRLIAASPPSPKPGPAPDFQRAHHLVAHREGRGVKRARDRPGRV